MLAIFKVLSGQSTKQKKLLGKLFSAPQAFKCRGVIRLSSLPKAA